MTEERKIKAALKVDANQIHLPADLFERINRQADSVAPARPGIWARLRLGEKLELAAACVLLVGLLGIAAYHNLNPIQAPAGGDQGSGTHGAAAETPARRIYSGEANDGTVRVQVVLDHQGNGDWNVVSTIQNVSSSSQIELQYDCDNLMRLDGSLIKRDCNPLLNVVLAAGQTKTEELTLPGRYQGTPTSGWLAYSIRSEGKQDPMRTLKVSIQEGVRQCCPEPDWSSSDVVVKFQAAGLNGKLTGDLSTKLFGAKQVQSIAAEGENVVVYVFDNIADAQRALKTMQDPQAHTVSWAGKPQFFQMGNLIVQIDFSNEQVAQKLKVALLGKLDLQRQGPGPDTGDVNRWPTVEEVTSAYIPGGRKMPDWRLTKDAIKKVLTMLQATQWVAGDETVPPPSSGPAQPLTLILELASGDTVSIRMAGDCKTITRADGSQVTKCEQAEDQILVFQKGRGGRYRAPELARWLSDGWQQDANFQQSQGNVPPTGQSPQKP